MSEKILNSRKKFQPIITELRREIYRLRQKDKKLVSKLEEVKREIVRLKEYYQKELAELRQCE